ncbi:MAG: hypothetical protein HFG16_07955 [Erysipelotrichaceae bacterium]|jgi:hypothetical protein|nr:hypothetical protein [Erysipelotrichaceae bacterium]
MHKTVMIFILAVMLLSGCSNKKEREAEAMSNYVSFRDAIIDNNGLTSENIPFSHRLEVNKLTDGRFEYVVTIYDADVAMYNIEWMIYDKSIDNGKNEEIFPTYGIIDEDTKDFTMLPFQSRKEKNFVSGMQLSGISQTPKFSLNILVTWKDYSKTNTYRAFFNYDYEYTESEEAPVENTEGESNS